MNISKDTVFGVIGLGVLGGSYVRALSSAGYTVKGIDINAETLAIAEENGWISEGSADPRLIADCDIVISCLYPHAFIQWIRTYGHVLKKGCLLTDVTGVKRMIIEQVNALLDEDIEFIACHPMAGREFRGIRYSDPERFRNANFIIVPAEKNTGDAISAMEQLAKILGFGTVTRLSAEKHDEMIGFLSQLTHVIAVCLMNSRDTEYLAEYSGDSFRDLTRIAVINEDLWPELFLMNKDYLLSEIDAFTAEMQSFRALLETEDEEGMKEKLRGSTRRRRMFEK